MRVAALTAAALLLTASALPAAAHEPDGRIRFRTEGLTAPSPMPVGLDPGERLLRLTIEGVVPIDEAVLVHSAPQSVSQRLVAVRRGAGSRRLIDRSSARPELRTSLGPLAPGEPLVLDFAEDWPDGGGGIVIVSVEAVSPDGTPLFQESFSFVVGSVGPPGVERNGAIEYPAHQITEAVP